jgi:hypothetical protein
MAMPIPERVRSVLSRRRHRFFQTTPVSESGVALGIEVDIMLFAFESVDCQCIEQQLLCPNKIWWIQESLMLRVSELCFAMTLGYGKPCINQRVRQGVRQRVGQGGLQRTRILPVTSAAETPEAVSGRLLRHLKARAARKSSFALR